MPMVIVKSGRGVTAKVNGMVRRTQDASAAWPKVGAYLARTTRQQFATKGGRLGTPWQPLKPKYRLWKIKHGFNRNILVMTGDLRNSFVSRPMSIEEYKKTSAVFGSKDKKAVWHQYGTRRNGKRVNPPRVMLKATPEVRAEVKKIITRHIVGKASK